MATADATCEVTFDFLRPNNPILAEILGDLNTASKMLVRAMRNRMRPSVVLRPQLMRCETDRGELIWGASYGDLYSFGETPELAYQEFDRGWMQGI